MSGKCRVVDGLGYHDIRDNLAGGGAMDVL